MNLKERSIAAEQELRDWWKTGAGVMILELNEAESYADLIAEQRAEIERLSVDAERYRWLREQHDKVDPQARVVWLQFHGQENDPQWVNTACGKSLDAAIDAARKEKP